jgi:hypothetical protein
MHLFKAGARFWLETLALGVCALGPTSCADARGRFEDFQNRLAADGGTAQAGTDDGGPCAPPPPNSVDGPALLAIDTNLTAGHPILFLGTIDTPPLEGTTAVHFTYRALDSLDRQTRVGPVLEVGPFALHDGVLTAPVPESTLDGDANPLLHGAPITSEMTLTGHVCGVSPFYCGTLSGSTSGLLSGTFTGRYGITLLSGPNAVPAQPRFGCDPTDLAPAL